VGTACLFSFTSFSGCGAVGFFTPSSLALTEESIERTF
jgi:hypothetical protein